MKTNKDIIEEFNDQIQADGNNDLIRGDKIPKDETEWKYISLGDLRDLIYKAETILKKVLEQKDKEKLEIIESAPEWIGDVDGYDNSVAIQQWKKEQKNKLTL